MRARRIPDIVRTDRGPEMTSAVMEEFIDSVQYEAVLGSCVHAEASRTWREEAYRPHVAMVDLYSSSVQSISAGMGRSRAGGGIPDGYGDRR
eukprot:8241793-Karenia_brevis.AAC.1